jgi:DNA replication and repair protein RecF
MIFSSLRTTAFRNLADSEVLTGAKDVFLVGENGQGKSNFLEALYFCAYASSFRAAHDNELARNGEKDFSAGVTISEPVPPNQDLWADNAQSENDRLRNTGLVLVKYEKGKKTVHINGKRVEDRKELLSIAPCIVFCHEDMEFVSGTHERRRWFFDQVLSLCDPVYLDDLRCFKRVLKSRNAVLRDAARHINDSSLEPVLDAIDPQYVMYGEKLMEKREIAARLFSDVFGPLYKEVSAISGITVQYVQSWKTSKETISFLRERRASDITSGLSLSGPHRDRYVFAHNGQEFAGKASTGQRRLLALLLRAAQARRFSEMTKKKPVLLLDDVLLEMDGEKRRRFLSVLPGYDQAFYTFLPEEPYKRYCKTDTLVYNVKEGQLLKI